VQPFALVTLWYSTNGAIWSTDNTTYSVGWLAPVHECEWDAVGDGKKDLQCNSNEEVIQMYLLRGYNLSMRVAIIPYKAVTWIPKKKMWIRISLFTKSIHMCIVVVVSYDSFDT